MKFALILASDIPKKDWICYAIADSSSKLRDLNCYNSNSLKLPKSQYPGKIDNTPVIVRSCETGSNSEFRIVEINNLQNFNGSFNLQ
ncbi:hypothetical protein SIO70_23065 [Chitinophaga sancti]|uniref:hypothetical protein n=1 Tax=Chitinophaga sancti TaxID=1004 RepID=UPI002A75C31A|nr:hypothetical protein [Chitinophaga sancti]WPQ61244.1 hypothetical protein SIO70_23065 [Chitinophaga sancti]